MKKLGLFIIVGLLSMTIPQMNANTFTVQAATIKKVTGVKKNRVKDGSYFYSKKNIRHPDLTAIPFQTLLQKLLY